MKFSYSMIDYVHYTLAIITIILCKIVKRIIMKTIMVFIVGFYIFNQPYYLTVRNLSNFVK